MKRTVYLLFIYLSLIIPLSCAKESAPLPQPKPDISVSAYLDIETTGLKISENKITVIGIYLEKPDNTEFIQLVDAPPGRIPLPERISQAGVRTGQITTERLKEILKNVTTLYTYNGIRFDLPFIMKKLNLDINQYCKHIDLMNICHKKNLYGGLKKTEQALGISRESDIDGSDAIRLWNEYKNKGSQEALNTLLKYNKEDAVNLSHLRVALDKLP